MNTLITEMEFVARSYEVDATLELKPATYMNWLQEIAWEAARDAGCPPSWFLENHLGCVYGASRFDKEKPIRYGDRIIARTWFSRMEGSRGLREFDLRRADNDKVVLRGQGEMVLIDLRTLKPTDWGELIHKVKPNGESFYNQYQPAAVAQAQAPVTFELRRPVQAEELDMARHVNNSVYLRWMADALQSFLRPRLGDVAERASPSAVNIRFGAPLVQGQNVRVSGKLEGIGEGLSRWSFEVGPESGTRRPTVGELNVRWSPEWTAALHTPIPE
ncbi:MAG: acyl-ACP thioesterase domain-containing protein [Myxococcaceae bacterium]